MIAVTELQPIDPALSMTTCAEVKMNTFKALLRR